jgi:hypothetical protein
VATLTGNREYGGGDDGGRQPHLPRHRKVRNDRDRVRLYEAPLGFDRVIVSGLSHDGDTARVRRGMVMKVNGSRDSWVLQFPRMNVQKRRLQEAPVEGGDAQNSARCPHNLLFNLPSNWVCATYSSTGVAMRPGFTTHRYSRQRDAKAGEAA